MPTGLPSKSFRLVGNSGASQCLRDNREEMSEALDSAIDRETSLILTTGGLGPTPDDMTVEVVASLIGTKSVVSEETVAEYRKRREMPENDVVSEALMKMATVPETAVVLQNPAGWGTVYKCGTQVFHNHDAAGSTSRNEGSF